ncbi:ABC transporter permease [Thermodesulfobacteriota bacterium]
MMKIRQLVIKEIIHRKLNFFLSVFAIVIATSSLICSVMLLRVHELRTSEILQKKEAELKIRMDKLKDDTRKSMLKLGFNLVILPEEQNMADWYSDDYSTMYMPEAYAERLAASDIIYIRHILPSLQEKITWPEHDRTIILVGTRGEIPNQHLSPKKPMVQPVPDGTIVLGYELHTSLNIKVNDKVDLMGKTFTVKNCYQERGTKDDITAWISLKDSQTLLKKEGLINAILALKCLCANNILPVIRKEVAAILPGTRVIERGSRVIAREEARTQVADEANVTLQKEIQGREIIGRERKKMVSILIPVILLACALWVAFMGFINVRSRREEIGILRTVGVSARTIFMLFTWKHIFIGIIGGISGIVLAGVLTFIFTASMHSIQAEIFGSVSLILKLALVSIIGASFLTIAAGWIPSMIASGQDPAEVLREE